MIAEGLKEAGISRDDMELVRPVVDAIHVMDDGHILIGIVEKVGEATSTFDVFDPEGIFLGTLDLGFVIPGRNIPAIVGDTIIAVTPWGSRPALSGARDDPAFSVARANPLGNLLL